MNYGEVLQKSWKIIWKNKILWLFGLLASCGSSSGGGGGGGGGSAGGNGNSSSGIFPGTPFQNLPPWLEDLGRTFERMVEDGTIWWVVAGIVVFILLMIAVTLMLSAIGRAGLARGTWLADSEDGVLNLSRVWRESRHYFWRVLLLTLLIGVGSAVLVLILIAPAILLGIATMGIGLLCMIPFLCLIVPVAIAIGVLEELAVVSITGEDKGVFESIRRSWQVIRSNLGPVVVMTLILLVGGGIARVVIGLPAILILVPIVIGLIAGSEAAMTGGFIAAGVILLIYLPIALLLSSVLQAYLGSAWALTYRRLVAKENAPTIEPNIPEVLSEDNPPVA